MCHQNWPSQVKTTKPTYHTGFVTKTDHYKLNCPPFYTLITVKNLLLLRILQWRCADSLASLPLYVVSIASLNLLSTTDVFITGSARQTNTSSSVIGNNGGCKPFPKSCKTECVSIDSLGCVVCNCPQGAGEYLQHLATNYIEILKYIRDFWNTKIAKVFKICRVTTRK